MNCGLCILNILVNWCLLFWPKWLSIIINPVLLVRKSTMMYLLLSAWLSSHYWCKLHLSGNQTCTCVIMQSVENGQIWKKYLCVLEDNTWARVDCHPYQVPHWKTSPVLDATTINTMHSMTEEDNRPHWDLMRMAPADWPKCVTAYF